jgi:hypothetical protein
VNLNKKERELLTTLSSLLQKMLRSSRSFTTNRAKAPRLRRSRADAVELRKQVKAARRREVPVKEIARELGITPSYVYQLQR